MLKSPRDSCELDISGSVLSLGIQIKLVWFNTLIYCKIITTIVLANTSIMSHNYHFFFVVRTFKIYSLSNFQVYSIVLLPIITMLYIRSPEIIHVIIGSLYPLTNTSPFPTTTRPSPG